MCYIKINRKKWRFKLVPNYLHIYFHPYLLIHPSFIPPSPLSHISLTPPSPLSHISLTPPSLIPNTSLTPPSYLPLSYLTPPSLTPPSLNPPSPLPLSYLTPHSPLPHTDVALPDGVKRSVVGDYDDVIISEDRTSFSYIIDASFLSGSFSNTGIVLSYISDYHCIHH